MAAVELEVTARGKIYTATVKKLGEVYCKLGGNEANLGSWARVQFCSWLEKYLSSLEKDEDGGVAALTTLVNLFEVTENDAATSSPAITPDSTGSTASTLRSTSTIQYRKDFKWLATLGMDLMI